MPRWGDNKIFHPEVINKTLQQTPDYEKKQQIQSNSKEKSARRKCRGHLNHKFFSENIIYDPLTVFFKTARAINIKIR